MKSRLASAMPKRRVRCRAPNQSIHKTWSFVHMVGPNTGIFRCKQYPWMTELHNIRRKA